MEYLSSKANARKPNHHADDKAKMVFHPHRKCLANRFNGINSVVGQWTPKFLSSLVRVE